MRNDAQTDVLLGMPKSAICVQRFDDSLNSAIHITYRSLLRSSSMHEPRDPPLRVVSLFSFAHVSVCKHVSKKINGAGPVGVVVDAPGSTPLIRRSRPHRRKRRPPPQPRGRAKRRPPVCSQRVDLIFPSVFAEATTSQVPFKGRTGPTPKNRSGSR